MTTSKTDKLALLDKHVDGVRHYLHLQIGKPLSKDLISAPEIALDNLHRELTAALAAPENAETAAAWLCIDDRYPYVKGIVTDRKETVESWTEGDIKFVGLYPLADARVYP
jgi:hypothetical protein